MSLSKSLNPQLDIGASKGCCSPNNVIYSIKLPYSVCKDWSEQAGNKESTAIPVYHSLLSTFLTDKQLVLDPKNDRLAQRLRRVCPKIQKQMNSAKGNTYYKLQKSFTSINIKRTDLLGHDEFVELQTKKDHLESELLQANESVSENLNEILKLRQELIELNQRCSNQDAVIADQHRSIVNLSETNKQLKDYVETIISSNASLPNPPKAGFAEIGRSYQRKILRQIKGRAECAMWFLKEFGLDVECIRVRDNKGEKHCLNYQSAEEISQAEKEKLQKVLQLLDRFYISDAFYHELSILSDNLPRTYLIKQLRSEMNTLCHIKRTPGKSIGAEVCVVDEVKFAIRSELLKNPEAKKFTVKFGGDGTSVSRVSGMCLMSFSLWDSDSYDSSSTSCHHTVAVVNGQESYEMYHSSFGNVFKSINALSTAGIIKLDEREFELNVCMGGDYKYLRLVLGMAGSTANYACMYCKIHKNDRGDMSKEADHYQGDAFLRSIEELARCAKNNSFDFKFEPLVSIPLSNIVIDELHLMLRITDRLISNLIEDADDLDSKERQGILPKQLHLHIDTLVKCFNKCGVTFRVWDKKDAQGKNAGHDCTSLMGQERKKLLKQLHVHLLNSNALHPNSKDVVAKIWRDFDTLYSLVNHDYADYDDFVSADLFSVANNWMKQFISLSGVRKGYEEKKVTPYMHCLVYHVPFLASKHLGLKKFSGQGMEKANDIAKSIYLQHSNKIDGCGSILKGSLRQLHLKYLERGRRPYEKKDGAYWTEEIFKKRKIDDNTSAENVLDEAEEASIESMTATQLKEKLKDLGVNSRKKTLDSLRKELMEHLKSK